MPKILIAEDSPTDLAFIRDAFEETSHQLITAMDGKTAEQIARTEGVDLIILDVVMPGKNGFHICRSLKKDPRFKDIPIILTTSKTAESDKFWGKKQGANEYLTKPFGATELLAAVQKYLGASR